MQIDYASIEKKWKERWEQDGVYRVSHDDPRPKYYVLDMFPYPSGSGLHVGHPLGYIASDIVSRYKRMDGYNVLHPMGYDAFGLPAEQYAVQTGIHPAISTEDNINRYRNQLLNLGFSYDWSREVKTCDPRFYKWTQWIFLQLFHHYYDTERNTARPVAELIASFEANGTHGVHAAHSYEGTFDATTWQAMTPKEQDDVLMNYRLAYRKISYVNWCEALGTVLANDEVKDGVSERGGYPVERKAMLQWSLRITAYAERLLRDLDDLEWTDAMKTIQSNWIGRSEGAEVEFPVRGRDASIRVFTTRPDTIFGATFMVLAPEHPLVAEITTPDQQLEVRAYQEQAALRSERERIADVKEISGVFTGAFAVNPVTGRSIPVWAADYVLMDYGTGAIMAVPGDDTRDGAFARHFDLPIVEVIDRSAFPDAEVGDKVGTLQNSDFLNGMEIPEAIEATLRHIETQGLGVRTVQYKLRDAIYSRQRYWGEPIPILYDQDGVAHAMDVQELPHELPMLDDFQPSGTSSPLARLPEWVDAGNGMTRETDTMPGYAGSSWYFLRYMDPYSDDVFASPEAIAYWKDVDLYIGGTEHAVGHLMYSRFWHKFLYDKGLVPTVEPFRKLINQGMIQGVIEYLYMYKEKVDGYTKFLCARLAAQHPEELFARIPILVTVVENYGTPDSYLSTRSIEQLIAWRPEYEDAIFECSKGVYHRGTFTPRDGAAGSHLYTDSEVGKMGKRYHNAVNPDTVVAEYGADCFRMYEMFLGPIDQSKPWDTNNIDGVSRFIRRFWNLFHSDQDAWQVTENEPSGEELKILHGTIKRVREDIERYSFNTCVSHFMTATNELKKLGTTSRAILDPLVRLIAPFAPFISEALWEQLGGSGSVHLTDYPKFDASLLIESTITYPVCINGKKRTEADFTADASPADIEQVVLALEAVQKWIDGKTVRKVIVVPKRMINIVV
ncbi:MAG: class I tRNA ligase family protein [Saprospiraceae bacterium]|nr:class I tRNA ligase family protein [Saprospiraceae bacterium]